MELTVSKGTKEGESFKAFSKKHSQFIADCKSQLKYLVIETVELDMIEKKKLAVISFMESVHNISEGFLTYINAHVCLIDVIEFYRDHLAVHINASKERIFEDYKKNYKLEEMPRA